MTGGVRRIQRSVLALLVLAWCFASSAFADGGLQARRLPPEAREVLSRIERGGPYRYERDGVVFGNYERALPERRRGYYREYTVETPGVRHRGARRLVVGCERDSASGATTGSVSGFGGFADCRGPAEVYYTEDHYRSFRRVSP